MLLTERDLEALQTAVLALHEERELESFRTAFFPIVLAAIPAEHCTWMEVGFDDSDLKDVRKVVTLWESSPRLTPKLQRALVSHIEDHPFTTHARATGQWGPFRLSDFWTPKQLRASAVWRDAYQHLNVGRLLAGCAFRANRMVTLNFARPLAARDFSERDRRVLELLLPHFVQALQSAERHTAVRTKDARPLPMLGFTPRESEVAVWLARGRTNPEIASILGMSRRTVEKHVENILAKLAAGNRTEAAMLVAGAMKMTTHAGPGAR